MVNRPMARPHRAEAHPNVAFCRACFTGERFRVLDSRWIVTTAA
jgi:hypothetical protein